MTLPATDNFNRSNANPAGGNWTTQTGFADMQIFNNLMYGTTGNVWNGANWNADAFGDDQYSEFAEQNDSPYGGPCVRAASGNCYFIYCINGTQYVYKNIGMSFTQLGATYTESLVTGYVIRLSIVGDTLTPKINGVDLATRSDSAIASGSAGVGFYGQGVLDDWEGGNVAAGGPFNVVMTII